jgi:hypothetical protein
LAGKSEWDQAKVDELINIQKDFYKEFSPFYYSAAGFADPEQVWSLDLTIGIVSLE